MRPRLAACLVVALALSAGCQPTTSPELPTNGLKPLLKMPVPRYKAGSPASTEQEVAFKTLAASREQYQTATASLKADSQPGDVAAALEAYSAALEVIDAKGSPIRVQGGVEPLPQGGEGRPDGRRARPERRLRGRGVHGTAAGAVQRQHREGQAPRRRGRPTRWRHCSSSTRSSTAWPAPRPASRPTRRRSSRRAAAAFRAGGVVRIRGEGFPASRRASAPGCPPSREKQSPRRAARAYWRGQPGADARRLAGKPSPRMRVTHLAPARSAGLARGADAPRSGRSRQLSIGTRIIRIPLKILDDAPPPPGVPRTPSQPGPSVR